MNRIFVLIAVLLFAVSASAAELRWQIETSAGTISQASPTVSDANMDRFLDYVWALHPQFDPITGDPLPKTQANLAAAYRQWALGQWRELRSDVLRYERDIAAAAAEEAVPDIE